MFKIFTLALLLLSTTSVSAADMWTGLYASARMGYTIKGDANNKPLATENDAVKMNGFGSAFGWGYSVQTGRFVTSVTGEIAARNIRGNNAVGGSLSVPVETNLTMNFGTLIQNDFLLYGLIGVSAAVIQSKTTVLGVENKEARTGLGFVTGVGIEKRLHRHWSLFAEYRFTNFETIQFSGFAANVSPTTHDIRTGVNYRF